MKTLSNTESRHYNGLLRCRSINTNETYCSTKINKYNIAT